MLKNGLRGAVPLSGAASWPLIGNALLLASATIVQSALGPVFWWVAARQFAPGVVGLSSAALSAVMLLGTLAMLGLGTALMGELPRNPEQAGTLLPGALMIAAGGGVFFGLLFAGLAPLAWAELSPLAANVFNTLLFAAGAGLTAMAAVFDQAMVALLRSKLQFWRGVAFAGIKLLILAGVGVSAFRTYSLSILFAHVAGLLLSLALVARVPEMWRRAQGIDWGLLFRFSRTALSHHLLNLALQAPSLLLPIIVTSLLSAERNAAFYIAWMLSGVLYMAPVSLTSVLFTMGAGEPRLFAAKARVTFTLSIVVGCVGCLVILLGADDVLGLFGPTYAEQASHSMRLLALGVFPLSVRQHYVAMLRLEGRMLRATRVVVLCAIVQLGLATVGARGGDLTGLSIGFLVGLCVEAALMGKCVLKLLSGRYERLDG